LWLEEGIFFFKSLRNVLQVSDHFASGNGFGAPVGLSVMKAMPTDRSRSSSAKHGIHSVFIATG